MRVVTWCRIYNSLCKFISLFLDFVYLGSQNWAAMQSQIIPSYSRTHTHTNTNTQIHTNTHSHTYRDTHRGTCTHTPCRVKSQHPIDIQTTMDIYVNHARVGVLQCVVLCGVVWCSVLQCVVVWCSVLQCVEVCCSVVQCDAVWCSVL